MKLLYWNVRVLLLRSHAVRLLILRIVRILELLLVRKLLIGIRHILLRRNRRVCVLWRERFVLRRYITWVRW